MCEIKMTQENFNLLINDINENPGVKEITPQQLQQINEIISSKIENNLYFKKYDFIEYHQKNIISYYKKWIEKEGENENFKLEEE